MNLVWKVRKVKKYLYIITVIILFFDQMIKQIVVSQLALHDSISIIPSFFNISYVQNLGGAWGILNHYTWILILLSIGIFLFFSSYLSKQDKITRVSTISYGLFFGGLLGNLADRILRGYVIDYLDFYIFGYDFPVFNLADIAIVVAIFLLIIEMWRDEVYDDRNRQKGKN